VNYLGKFVQSLTDLTEPFRQLIKAKVEWQWGPEQDEAFNKIKQALSDSPVLKYYDVNADVKLQVDASSKAMSAVLMQDGLPVP
jgi:RNase H-like domain found in reverse transcriptase